MAWHKIFPLICSEDVDEAIAGQPDQCLTILFLRGRLCF